MTNEFTVVGEHKDNELELLVLGADGTYYGYRPAQDHFHPVEPDDTWLMAETPERGDAESLPTDDIESFAAR